MSARSTASLRNVPPCTTMRLPRLARLGTRTTFVNTLAMIERHRPAMMSAGVRPFFCSLTMLEFMNTVQRLPSTAGCRLENASSAMRDVGMSSARAKFSRNEPQPLEHASFTTMLLMTPLSSQMAFMSWPPMSRMNVASGMKRVAAWACATVSTVWKSACRARASSSSP